MCCRLVLRRFVDCGNQRCVLGRLLLPRAVDREHRETCLDGCRMHRGRGLPVCRWLLLRRVVNGGNQCRVLGRLLLPRAVDDEPRRPRIDGGGLRRRYRLSVRPWVLLPREFCERHWVRRVSNRIVQRRRGEHARLHAVCRGSLWRRDVADGVDVRRQLRARVLVRGGVNERDRGAVRAWAVGRRRGARVRRLLRAVPARVRVRRGRHRCADAVRSWAVRGVTGGAAVHCVRSRPLHPRARRNLA